tara:strand:+ start:4366 stop:5748 length:1383 start_codon:yes stop_codon:yes gene_type:complete
MEFLPVFLNIKGRKCVVVGGGDIARRKAVMLVEAGGIVDIITGHKPEKFSEFGQHEQITLIEQNFNADHLKGAVLAVAATDDPALNRAVSKLANDFEIPINVVDQPDLCSFIMPSIVDRSPVLIAISSSGNSPVLTRRIKELNDTLVPARMGELATLLGSYRVQVSQEIPEFSERVSFWERLLDSEVPEMVYSGNTTKAKEHIEAALSQKSTGPTPGEVYLVGAGPGDPDLLTLRALRLMYKADVVLYDRLVSAEILKRVRPDAEKIHVGKARADHTIKQETINEMLVRLAKDGKKVLRLKGGDPFIFGRGGEELETLANEEIQFQVVPGITAASGCAAYAGIPLTHRDFAQSVLFLTGQLKDGSVNLNWESLVVSQQTLVFYMGSLGLQFICEKLVAHGMDSDMPIAVVQQGTTRDQKVLVSTLAELPEAVLQNPIKPPTIIIVGRVVKLKEKLAWFES